MPDIVIEDYVKGESLERFIALLDGVQSALRDEAETRGGAAHGILLAHRDKGDSKIEVNHGDVDWYVDLDDTSGDQAAWAIEMETGALRTSFGLGD